MFDHFRNSYYQRELVLKEDKTQTFFGTGVAAKLREEQKKWLCEN